MSVRITLYKQGEKSVKVRQIITVNELLSDYKFVKTGACNCNGIFTEKYKNENFILKVRPRRNQHQLSYKSGSDSGITNWVTLTELKAKLDELTKMGI